MQKKEIYIKGYKVHYVESGQGETLVHLPSTLVLLKTYTNTLNELEKYFKVISVELPGCGFSSLLEKPWTFEDYALWLKEFFIVMNIKKCTIIGHSDSGGIAIIMAALYPEFINKVILADTVGAKKSSVFKLVVARIIDGIIEPKLTLSAWYHLFLNAVFHPRNFLYQIKLAGRSDLKDYEKMIKVPSLIAWGKYDHTLPVSHAKILSENIPDNKIYISESGSHDWCITEPEKFAKIVSEF